jgi:hypothetical protein
MHGHKKIKFSIPFIIIQLQQEPKNAYNLILKIKIILQDSNSYILYECGLPDDGTLRAETCSCWWFTMLL